MRSVQRGCQNLGSQSTWLLYSEWHYVIFDADEDNEGDCDDNDVDDEGGDGHDGHDSHDEDEAGRGMVSIGSLQRRQTAAGLKITRTTKKGQKYQLTKWKES